MGNNIKILLVEDEYISSKLMKKELEKQGFEVIHSVSTGENAVISARQNPPDIILMDIMLAGEMDGIQAASAIKSESDTSVIIFVTGYDDEQIKERAKKIDPLDFLIKPVDMNQLKLIINSHFQSFSG
jgi:DNA-binding response OmpR family regulator